jgi:hypothetical protein
MVRYDGLGSGKTMGMGIAWRCVYFIHADGMVASTCHSASLCHLAAGVGT